MPGPVVRRSSLRSVCFMVLGLLACLVPSGSSLATAPLAHGSTLNKIKQQGFLRCGGVLRPGLVMTDGKGHWSGLEVEICRAVAVAVFGAAASYTFHDYGSTVAYDSVRSGEDQLAFLTFAEMADQTLTDKVLPGPAVFVESLDMLVAEASPAKRFEDIAGKGICFIIGTSAETELEAWFHDRKLQYIPYAFQEDGEEYDAFNVQTCQGLVGESTTLGSVRLDRGVNNLSSRFIADHLLSFPVVATTPLTEDTRWAAIVAWTIATLFNADAHETDYHASGLRAMTVDGAGLGLAAGWQKAVVDRVGSYSDIFRRKPRSGIAFQARPGAEPAGDRRRRAGRAVPRLTSRSRRQAGTRRRALVGSLETA